MKTGDQTRTEWVENQVNNGKVKIWEDVVHGTWFGLVYEGEEPKRFSSFKKQQIINEIYTHLNPVEFSSPRKGIIINRTKPIKLPPHLQAVCKAWNEKQKAFGYSVEEISCDQLFKN